MTAPAVAADSGEAFASWKQLLEIARHAPSPHNVQPWRVRLLSDTTADLLIDGARMLPREDLTGSFILSAMGMILEAIDLMAASFGLQLRYQLFESPGWFAAKARTLDLVELIPFAHLELVPAPGITPAYSPEIFLKRRTCRISLHPTPVDPSAAAALAVLAQDWGQRYGQTEIPNQIERILAANIDAVFHDLNLPPYRDEITSWFRLTDGAAMRHRDGLDRRCMNLSFGEFWLMARMPWLLVFPPARALLKVLYRRQLGRVPAIGYLSARFFEPENAIDSGRFLMRFWLELTRHGLYIHPYGNLVTNPQAAAWLAEELKQPDIWLIFKLGYADEPPQSYRRNLEDILVA